MDRVYQVELEIVHFMLPSLLKDSQNSLQGSLRRVQSRYCPLGFEETLTFPTLPGIIIA